MFDRRDLCLTQTETGRERCVTDILRAGGDVLRGGEIGAPEYDTVVDRSRAQGEKYFLARMQTDASRLDRIPQRPLSDHCLTLTLPRGGQ